MRCAESIVMALLPERLRDRLLRLAVEHKQIARGLFVVGFFVLIGKFAGAAKEMAIAWRYGISETVDAYLFVFNLAQWPVGILGGVIGSVLVPLAVRARYEDPEALPGFRAELWGASLWISFVFGAIAFLVLPWLLQQSWLGLTGKQADLAGQMAPYLAWTLPFALIAKLLAGWTMAGNRHLNTLLEGMPALAILIAVLLAAGTGPLIWGTLGGFILQALFLYMPLAQRGEAEWPLFAFRSDHWRIFLAGLGVMLVGQALMSLVSLLDQIFAAHLGTGALSTLGYANRILSLILGLGAVAVSRALLPVLSRAHAKGHGNINRIASRWAALLFAAGLGVAVIGVWLAPIVVKLLFQRGQFAAEDSVHVTELLRYALVQLPFYFSSMVLVYALLSQGRYTSMMVLGGSNLLLKLILAIILVPILALKGLMLSTAGVYFGSALLAAWMLRFRYLKNM